MHTERVRRILGLGLPIIGGMMSQNLLNLVDAAMVAHLGDSALAATGMASFANFLAQAPLLGLGAGVQAMAARRLGEGKEGETAVALNAGLVLAVTFGFVLTVGLFLSVPTLFPFLNDDPEVVHIGVPYLQARMLAIIAVGCNISFRGYWNGVNMSRLYMFTLFAMHATNIVLNYLLIFGKFGFPELGAVGAGLGTSLSLILGSLIYVGLGLRVARKNGFLRIRPTVDVLRGLAKLALPNSIQQVFFAAGFTTMFWIIGQVGTAELAAANVLLNITLVGILPGMGLGLAATSLVGQALGHGEPDDAARWGWDVVRVAAILMGAVGVPLWLAPELPLSMFLHDPETLALARWPLRITGLAMALDAVSMVLLNALLGAGDSRTAMKVSIISQWGVFLPVAYVLGPVMGMGLVWIWSAYIAYRSLQSVVFAVVWYRGGWRTIRV